MSGKMTIDFSGSIEMPADPDVESVLKKISDAIGEALKVVGPGFKAKITVSHEEIIGEA